MEAQLNTLVVSIRANAVPFYRAMGMAGAKLALLVTKDPRRRWKLRYRIERIERRRDLDRHGQPLPPALHCKNCGQPDQDLGLRAMKRYQPGTVGYLAARRSWAPEPCCCDEPEWEE